MLGPSQTVGWAAGECGDTVFDGSLDEPVGQIQVEMANSTAQMIRDSLQRFLVTD